MVAQPRWPRQALLPILGGLGWLWYSQSLGLLGFLFPLVPGCLLLASGTSMLLWPGDLRIPQFTALGGLIGVLMSLPAPFITGPGTALALLALSLGSFLAAGSMSILQEPHVDEVPTPIPSLKLAAKVAVDDALLATMQISLPIMAGGEWNRVRNEVVEARERFDAAGWLEKPADYHEAPPPLDNPEIWTRRSHGRVFEQMSFESGYAPRPEEPGRERWLSYTPNRTAHAWLVRHGSPEAPWLVCIHGYQMGLPLIDLLAFEPKRYHERMGLNLVLPVLPLHGPRKIGRRSGDGFISGDFMDTIHAEAQAMWDMRRLLSWIRGQGGSQVGVYGLSLGGYNASLLSSLDDDLACVIAGIPLVDITRASWRHGPPLHIRLGEHHGIQLDLIEDLNRVVSPLALECKVPKEQRYIFAGTADRLVPAEQQRDLWRHWDRPRIAWYQGSHMSIRWEPQIRRIIDDALRESGLVV